MTNDTPSLPEARVELDQAILDVASEMKSAVLDLSQTLADLSERLSDGALADKKMAAFEALMNEVSAALADVLGRDSSAAMAQALVQGLKDGLPQQQAVAAPTINVEVAAPQVNVAAPVVNIQPAEVKFSPVIQVPPATATPITIQTAKQWETAFTYNEYGRLEKAVSKKIA